MLAQRDVDLAREGVRLEAAFRKHLAHLEGDEFGHPRGPFPGDLLPATKDRFAGGPSECVPRRLRRPRRRDRGLDVGESFIGLPDHVVGGGWIS